MPSHSSSPFASSQYTTSAPCPRGSVSGTYASPFPARRRGNLIGLHIAHWTIVDSERDGYWIARCDCGGLERARFDAGQTIRVCRKCGASAAGTTMREARELAFRRAKYLRR
jgi:hypothetical protein